MSSDFSATRKSHTGEIHLVKPEPHPKSDTLKIASRCWSPDTDRQNSLIEYSFSPLNKDLGSEKLFMVSNSVHELAHDKLKSPFSDKTDVEQKTPPIDSPQSQTSSPFIEAASNKKPPIYKKDLRLQEEHSPKVEPKIFGRHVPIEEFPDYSFDEPASVKKTDFKPNYPHTSTLQRRKNNPTDRAQAVKDLGLEGYSPKVQKKIIDCYLSRKDSLDLSGCGLADIPPCLSTDFPWLSKLNLSNNELTTCHLEHDTLLYLNLANNKLETLTGKLPSVQTLNLFNNQFTHFKPDYYQFFSLTNLNIANNRLVDLPENLFSLEHLHCQGNKLTKMANPAIRFPRLNYLDIGDARLSISTIGKLKEFQAFQIIVSQLNLENYSFSVQLKIIDCYLNQSTHLDLSGCELTEIPSCLSTDFPWLSKLNLSDNQLTNCSLEHKGLSELLLQNNQLTTFSAKTPNVKILDISGNQLERFRIDPKQFTKLRYLDLSDNQLTKFSLNLLGLTHLILQNNKLKTLDIEFPSLEGSESSVDLSQSVELPELIVIPEHEHAKLEWLDLSGNQFEKLDAALQLPELRHLFINDNKLTDLPKNTPSLQELSCKNNQIAKISARASHFPVLTSLDITGNKLSKPLAIEFPSLNPQDLKTDFDRFLLEVQRLGLSRYSLDVQQKIITCLHTKSTSLDLSGCNLKTLPPCIVSHLSHITHLNLSHNDFKGVFSVDKKLLNLESLDLSFNKITAFNKDLTSDGYVYRASPPNLKRLNLSHNEFEVFTSPPGNLDKLEDLDISSNKLTRFSASKDQYPKLENLDLSFNPDLSEDDINFYDGLEIIPVLLK